MFEYQLHLLRCEPAQYNEAGSRTPLQLIIDTPTPIKPNYQNLFCPNNRRIIAQIVLIWS